MADWQEYEEEAQGAYANASTSDELSGVNVRYLGRRAPLPIALRGIRDPETGRQLNGLRVRLEEMSFEAAKRITQLEIDRHISIEGGMYDMHTGQVTFFDKPGT